MKTSDFDYCLPPEYIAQTPLQCRDASRMLVVDRTSDVLKHTKFRDLVEHLNPGDLLVFNDSRVIPARIYAQNTITHRNVEFLLLRRISPGIWHAIGKPGRSLKVGTQFNVADADVVIEVIDWREDGIRVLKLSTEEDMESWGHTPLPPYIRKSLEDPERYQTIYSQVLGSVAAPTAGLHFTEKVLDDLKEKGVHQVSITLHIGIDTFKPVDVEDPRNHQIHREYISCDVNALQRIKSVRDNGGRIIAVGTTVVRTLEQLALWHDLDEGNFSSSIEGWSDILILPGYKFKLVDSMITNFHLPKSTVLMMTSAFAGWERIEHAYMEAIKMNYRFYSFGDAMFIV